VNQQNLPSLQSVAQDKNGLQKSANVLRMQKLSITVIRSSSKQLTLHAKSAGKPPFTLPSALDGAKRSVCSPCRYTPDIH
jgi:hypothetical protein